MKKFKYNFSTMLYVLMGLGMIIAVACFIWNIVRLVSLVQDGSIDAYPIISISIAIVMSVVFAVIIITLLVDSSYCFEDNALILKFGLIKTPFDYSKIKQIVWFKETNKLTVFHKDESFTNIVIKDSEYELFVKTLIANNKEIVYYEDING